VNKAQTGAPRLRDCLSGHSLSNRQSSPPDRCPVLPIINTSKG